MSPHKKGTGRLDFQLTYLHREQYRAGGFYLLLNWQWQFPTVTHARVDLLVDPACGAGFAYPILLRSLLTPVSFNGYYGVRLTQATFGAEADFRGQFTQTARATLAGTLYVQHGLSLTQVLHNNRRFQARLPRNVILR